MSVNLTISNKVATVTLNRPQVHNAFDDITIIQLIDVITQACEEQVSVLVLKSEGRHFSAGADLGWMKSMAGNNFDDNFADSQQLAKLMHTLATCPMPTICQVQGAAFGGALGLIACCDIAFASPDTKFCLSEVKLGLIPAVISPYVIKAIGERQSRRYFLTAEVFKADKALNLGLIHEITDKLETSVKDTVKNILNNSPKAVIAAKELIEDVANKEITKELQDLTAERIASIRVSVEGQEGLSAFFEKRLPNWQTPNNNDSAQ